MGDGRWLHGCRETSKLSQTLKGSYPFLLLHEYRWCLLQAHLWSFVLRQINVSHSQIAASGEWPDRPNHRDRRLFKEEVPQSVRKLRTSEDLRRSVAARYMHILVCCLVALSLSSRRGAVSGIVWLPSSQENHLREASSILVLYVSLRDYLVVCPEEPFPSSLKRKRVIE